MCENENKKSTPPPSTRQCPGCGGEVEARRGVCPECGHHRRVHARERIGQLCDPDTFEEFAADLRPLDPLEFKDRMTYKDRLKREQATTGEIEAVVVGMAHIRGRPVILAVMNPAFIMASMGAVVGEKFCATVDLAVEASLPLVAVCASGGARMHEGVVSLGQMAKTAAALARFSDLGGLFITVLTHPTAGGVTASFGMLGDVTLAEPEAMIAFAGRRTIAETIRVELPESFQTSEFLLEHGFVDMIVPRSQLRSEIARLIDYCRK